MGGKTVNGVGSGSFYATVTGTGSFVEYTFVDPTDSVNFVSYGIRLLVTGASVDVSFDGTAVHGVCPVGDHVFLNRRQKSIWIRGVGATVRVYAW